MKSTTFLVLTSLTMLACSVDDPCDPGQTHRNGFCVAAPDQTGGAAGSSAETGGAPQGGEGGEAGAPGNSSPGGAPASDGGKLGDECASDDACSPAAHYCAINPGDTVGYCTPTGCDEDPSVCPSDAWSCEDQYMAFGYPSFCWPK